MKNHRSKHSWKELYLKISFFRVLFGIKNQTIVFQESPFFKGGCFLDKEQALFIHCPSSMILISSSVRL